jgi:hypothetical protein
MVLLAKIQLATLVLDALVKLTRSVPGGYNVTALVSLDEGGILEVYGLAASLLLVLYP